VGQALGPGRLGFIVAKIDPAATSTRNRFAGSGNTQFFGPALATNPAARSPTTASDSSSAPSPSNWPYSTSARPQSPREHAFALHHPHGHWFRRRRIGFPPRHSPLGKGIYRLMLYDRDARQAHELGCLSAPIRTLGDQFGLFLRYAATTQPQRREHIASPGFAFLKPVRPPQRTNRHRRLLTRPANHDLRDEYSAEAITASATEGIELSASDQYILDPSASDKTPPASSASGCGSFTDAILLETIFRKYA
jgi:hypothetical protein